ncbi:plasmid recombination protein [Castellaniella sp.]|uniref:plasmid recombination protein n=1 Tax=Castellaniella sp. TaxID=1955812 RepID=UPI002B0028B4|nr:plasmid recombination protein [Castellaniella sp.]
MTYQFIHIDVYARVGAKQKERKTAKGRIIKAKEKWSIRDILAEAGREPSNTFHIENPKKPNILYGVSLAELEKMATEWGDNAKDAKGRKLRKDGACLLAGVISMERGKAENWDAFKARSIEWLKLEYGERLRTVVEHLDETHPHIHFYAVPKAGENFNVLHKGRSASEKAKEENRPKGEQNKEYCQAMRLWQDQFHIKVASHFGMSRLGPGRRRLSREQWKAETHQASLLLTTKQKARKYIAHYKRKAAEAWAGMGFVDKFKVAFHLPSQKMKQKAKEAEEGKAEAEKEAERLKEENAKIEARAERRLEEGKEHAKDSRLNEDKAKKYKAKAAKLEAENEALRAEVADLKAPKPAPTPKHQKRQGYAL